MATRTRRRLVYYTLSLIENQEQMGIEYLCTLKYIYGYISACTVKAQCNVNKPSGQYERKNEKEGKRVQKKRASDVARCNKFQT